MVRFAKVIIFKKVLFKKEIIKLPLRVRFLVRELILIDIQLTIL